jgi:hypothetical protein
MSFGGENHLHHSGKKNQEENTKKVKTINFFLFFVHGFKLSTGTGSFCTGGTGGNAFALRRFSGQFTVAGIVNKMRGKVSRGRNRPGHRHLLSEQKLLRGRRYPARRVTF